MGETAKVDNQDVQKQQVNILIVDDRKENRIALKTLMANIDANLIEADSGKEALAQSLRYDFALILLDVQMPEMDGFETAKYLRVNQRTAQVPIIFVTALSPNDQNSLFSGYQAGAVDFLYKPLNADIFLSKVKIFLDIYDTNMNLQHEVERSNMLAEDVKKALDEQVLVKKALQSSESYLHDMINSMPSVLVGLDSDYSITHWNRSAGKFFDKTASEVIGKSFVELTKELKSCSNIVELAMKNRKTESIDKVRMLSNGNERFITLVAYPLRRNDAGLIIRLDDISQRVQVEDIMVQTEKMTSLGTLAAGMAHEINNPLSIILQGVQSIQRRFDPKLAKNQKSAEEHQVNLDSVHKYMDDRGILKFITGIQESGDRASVIVKNILNFSRRSEAKKSLVDINELIKEVLSILSTDYAIKKKIGMNQLYLETSLDETISEIACAHTEIEQVLLNIIKNATHALEDNKDEKKPTVHISTHLVVDRVRVVIQDNGCGIEESVRKRMFDPFFTTKPVGVGTGLGLSISYSIIVDKHHGILEVESTLGVGTKFIIELPALQDSGDEEG